MKRSVLIVGLGQIGLGFDLQLPADKFVYSHARAFHNHPAFCLVGGVDPDASKRAAFTAAYRTPAFESLEQAGDVLPVDLVIVATPTLTHYAIVCELLDLAGPRQAFLCEKPLSYDLVEAQAMLKEITDRNVAVYVNYMRRSEPGALEVKRRIASGEIASPIKGVAWYSKGFLHNGSHLFNLLEDWLGEMHSFSLIDSGRTLGDGDAEPDVKVRFNKGEVTFLAAKDENFSLTALDIVSKTGRLGYEDGGRFIAWRPIARDKELLGYTFLSSNLEEIPCDFKRYQYHVVDQLANALNGEAACLCGGQQALRTLEGMHSILESRK